MTDSAMQLSMKLWQDRALTASRELSRATVAAGTISAPQETAASTENTISAATIWGIFSVTFLAALGKVHIPAETRVPT